MFPLSTVLFPGCPLPLHVFEHRYRALVADCLAGDRRFGVVLIARGSEVGGGDERHGVATVAEIEMARPEADGRWLLAARGVERARVTRWLSDDPYPRAVVEPWASDPAVDGAALRAAEQAVRRAQALLSELGDTPAPAPRWSLGDSPEEIVWRLCALAPVTALDRQRLLEAPDAAARLALLVELVDAVGDDVDKLLSGG